MPANVFSFSLRHVPHWVFYFFACGFQIIRYKLYLFKMGTWGSITAAGHSFHSKQNKIFKSASEHRKNVFYSVPAHCANASDYFTSQIFRMETGYYFSY